jgi:hypothetical protein
LSTTLSTEMTGTSLHNGLWLLSCMELFSKRTVFFLYGSNSTPLGVSLPRFDTSARKRVIFGSWQSHLSLKKSALAKVKTCVSRMTPALYPLCIPRAGWLNCSSR